MLGENIIPPMITHLIVNIKPDNKTKYFFSSSQIITLMLTFVVIIWLDGNLIILYSNIYFSGKCH
jgi:hypothetical protein